MLSLDVGAATHTGNHRQLNEDSTLVAEPIFVVADGMGGHAAGDVASRLVVTRLASLAGLPDLQSDQVIEALDSANADILQEALQHPEQTGMGSTVTGIGVVLVGGTDHWMVFNIGDSRVYRFAGNELAQVTVDHSEVEELVAAGRISAEDAKVYPRRNVITRSIGTLPAPTADVLIFPPTPGERFLICSDGLTSELDDEIIAEVLARTGNPQVAAELLVAGAVHAGGHDNVSVVIVDYARPSDPTDDSGDTAPRALET